MPRRAAEQARNLSESPQKRRRGPYNKRKPKKTSSPLQWLGDCFDSSIVNIAFGVVLVATLLYVLYLNTELFEGLSAKVLGTGADNGQTAKRSDSLREKLDVNIICCLIPVVAVILLMVFVDYHSGQAEKQEPDYGKLGVVTRSMSKRMYADDQYMIDTPAAEQIIAQAQERQEAWERREKIQNRRKTPKRLSQSPDKKDRSVSRGKKKAETSRQKSKSSPSPGKKARKSKKNYILKRIESPGDS